MVSGRPAAAATSSSPSPSSSVFAAAGVGVFDPGWRWRAPPVQLPAGAVHLWAMDIGDLGDISDGAVGGGDSPAANLLDAAELARARRIAGPAQRALYLGGRAGMRLLLCAYSGLDNAELRFCNGPRGKPKLLNRLPGGGELCFNYSLSGGRALYAVARNRQVGIDLETWPRAINTEGLARRILSAAERRAWRALSATAPATPDGRAAAMLACWTRKEAYGKALGVGIRYRMKRAEVFAGAGANWRCAVDGLFAGAVAETDARRLHGVQLATPFAGIAALMYDGEAATVRGWRWRPGANFTEHGD